MSQAFERAQSETSGVQTYLLAGYYAFAGNFSLVVAVFGLLVVGFGATVLNGTVLDGALQHEVLAAMFGVWGTSFFVLGVLIYALFWASDLYARIESSES